MIFNLLFFLQSICRFGGVYHSWTRFTSLVAVLPVFYRFHALLLLTLANICFRFVVVKAQYDIHDFILFYLPFRYLEIR
jgi:hypothetical protein